jgi:hypothetical protein
MSWCDAMDGDIPGLQRSLMWRSWTAAESAGKDDEDEQ